MPCIDIINGLGVCNEGVKVFTDLRGCWFPLSAFSGALSGVDFSGVDAGQGGGDVEAVLGGGGGDTVGGFFFLRFGKRGKITGVSPVSCALARVVTPIKRKEYNNLELVEYIQLELVEKGPLIMEAVERTKRINKLPAPKLGGATRWCTGRFESLQYIAENLPLLGLYTMKLLREMRRILSRNVRKL